MTEAGALDGASATALVTNNVGSAYPTIVGAVVSVDDNKGATAAVMEAAVVANNINYPAIPPRW